MMAGQVSGAGERFPIRPRFGRAYDYVAERFESFTTGGVV